MRLWSVFRKSLREQIRGVWSLVLTLLMAPCFVVMYWLVFGGGSTTYGVLVINNDAGIQLADGSTLVGGDRAIKAIQSVTYADGRPMLKVTRVSDRAEAEAKLKNRAAAALVIIPPDFSRATLREASSQGNSSITATVTMVGDLTNVYYAVATVMASSALDGYIQEATGQPRPVQFVEEPLGASAARTEFETYVPALLVLSVVLLIFQAAMTVAREVEGGTLRRLQLTRMTSLDLLGGISATQVLIGVAAVILTFLTAWALGFRSQGPLWVAVIVGAVTSLSVVGVGLLVTCFARTVSEAFIVANFPLIILMFFSGAVFPVPPVPLFVIGGRAIGLFDFLPPTHAVVALNKVLTMGAGLGDVAYELTAVLVLSAAYFAIGIGLFNRTHLRAH